MPGDGSFNVNALWDRALVSSRTRRVDGYHLTERGTNKTVGHYVGVDEKANNVATVINVDRCNFS
jgi:hypothetical protein